MSSRQPITQQQPHDEVNTTLLRLKHEARQHLRTRPRRVIMLLFAAAFVSIIVVLFSWQHSLPIDYVQVQRYKCPLDSQSLFTSDLCESLPLPTHAVTTVSPSIHTVVVEPPVEPVVFALIVHSESSAKEGAVLLKVYFPGSTMAPFSDDKPC